MENSALSNAAGKLTIFLGASSGVGKSYTMLEAAYEKLSQGINVYIGCIEYSNRPEFGLFLKSIPFIKPEDSCNSHLVEMDIDSVLAIKPELVVIDNLAQRNLKGQRHNNRYQDIQELLQSGIDVYTTLNIYQVESLKDIAEQITGIKVIDTVPDRFLEIAEIKLIDISHDELLQRLKIGKVSLPSNSEQNLEKFFRLGNISALRELALRYTAQRVDKQLNEYMKAHAIKGPWPAGERILACVGPSPFSSHVIRIARRMADGLKADWCAAYVETQQRSPGDDQGYEQLDMNLRLAEELGAEIIKLNGDNVSKELLSLAERKNITQIVIGKPHHTRISELWKGSLVDGIVKGSRGISVHIIPGEETEGKRRKNENKDKQQQQPFIPYLFTFLLVILTTLINKLIGFDLINIALLYFLPVLFSAYYWGRGPSIFASILGVLSFDVFFVPPVFSITVEDLKYLLSFAVFLLVAVITGTMANKLRSQADTAHKREARTAALYSLSRKIVVETDIGGTLKTVIGVIEETIDGAAVILLPDESGNLAQRAFSEVEDNRIRINEDTAAWVFEHGMIAGLSTDTWGDLESLYIPLKTEEKNIGVLVVRPNYPQRLLSIEQSQLLEAIANLTALSVMSQQLSAEAQQARYLIQSEKLRTALFNSISHELRTPLASIMGAVTSLLDEDELYNQSDRQDLLLTMNEGVLRMNRLVGNLLDMARLESGMMQLKAEWCDIQEIIGVALRRMNANLQGRNIKIEISREIPLIKADFVLIEQVVVNLIDNAYKYSLPETDITIEAFKEEEHVCLSIRNWGIPIPEGDREKIFDKFYRLTSYQHITGTGLGLSICKGIIEAHGGRIWVETKNQETVFSFSLPVDVLPPGMPLERTVT